MLSLNDKIYKILGELGFLDLQLNERMYDHLYSLGCTQLSLQDRLACYGGFKKYIEDLLSGNIPGVCRTYQYDGNITTLMVDVALVGLPYQIQAYKGSTPINGLIGADTTVVVPNEWTTITGTVQPGGLIISDLGDFKAANLIIADNTWPLTDEYNPDNWMFTSSLSKSGYVQLDSVATLPHNEWTQIRFRPKTAATTYIVSNSLSPAERMYLRFTSALNSIRLTTGSGTDANLVVAPLVLDQDYELFLRINANVGTGVVESITGRLVSEGAQLDERTLPLSADIKIDIFGSQYGTGGYGNVNVWDVQSQSGIINQLVSIDTDVAPSGTSLVNLDATDAVPAGPLGADFPSEPVNPGVISYSDAVGTRAYPVDGNGWSIITPEATARLVYVDSINGDDGLASFVLASSQVDIYNPVGVTPFKTVTAAVAQMRYGEPDWILLAKGGEWDEQIGRDNFHGASLTRRAVCTWYNGATPSSVRPRFVSKWPLHPNGDPLSYIAWVGIECDPLPTNITVEEGGNDYLDRGKIRLVTQGEGFLFEDCIFRENMEILLQAWDGSNTNDLLVNKVQIRRCFVGQNKWGNSTNTRTKRPSGLFGTGVNEILLEENFFDHCGWDESDPNAKANQLNHGIYLTTACNNVRLVNNYAYRCANMGIQNRSNGINYANACIENSVGLSLGYFSSESLYDQYGYSAINVIMAGREQDPSANESTNAVWGLSTSRHKYDLVECICANATNDFGSASSSLYPTSEGAETNLFDCIGHNWNGVATVPIVEPTYTDPSRSFNSYAVSIGLAAKQDLIDANKDRDIGVWDVQKNSALEFVNYIQAGFVVV